jgi:hypothetical protein
MRGNGTTTAKIAGACGAFLLLNTGCLKTEEFPSEPVIEFKSFHASNDSASVVISFTDGDGDIGLDQGDTLTPFNPGSTWFYNFFIDYYTLENGVWVAPDPPLALPLYYRVPNITPTGQNKALEGDIAVALRNPILPGTVGDTIRLEVRLADRAQHMSNRVSSEPIVVE